MTFDEYQEQAATTAIYPDRHAITYPALGIANEAGEVAGKVKKVLRDHGGDFTGEQRDAVKSEIGDVLWYAAALARDLGVSLNDIAETNLAKLKDRAERGKIGGSGDRR